MKKNATKLLLCMPLLLPLPGYTQSSSPEIRVQMSPASWQFDAGAVEFTTVEGKAAMKILNSRSQSILKNVTFTDGTIEYDMQPVDPRFTSVYFREQSDSMRECFYFRTSRAGNNDAEDAVQYAPFIRGVELWDILPEYQSNAAYQRNKWNHIKLVISGKQMRVYVNSSAPTLVVPQLEGTTSAGAIGFDGQVLISGLVIKPGATEGLSPMPGEDITGNDPRYLRKWEVSKQFAYTKPGIDFDYRYMPDSASLWDPITAERRGLVNLTRRFGGDFKRKITWLRTTINAASPLTKRLQLGFSDEVWVFVNRQLLYLDKNNYNQLTMKAPAGRISLDNASFDLPLKAGENEILIAVVNDFYGWGIIARLEDNYGISLLR